MAATRANRPEIWGPWLLLAGALVSGFLLNTGQLPLFDVDEGAFSQATREMFLRGDFISTYLNGEPRYDKPILSYWLQAVSVSGLGFTEWGFRLPSVLCSLAWAGLLFWFGRRVADAPTGLFAALLFATTFELTIIGRAATADPLLNVLLAGTMFTLFLYLDTERRRYLYAAAILAGLGVLTKGPVAVAIPGLVAVLYCLPDWRRLLRLLAHPVAWALLLLTILPWYVAQYWKEGDAFIQGFFFKHNLGRFQQAMEGHGGGVWYYPPVVLVGFVPHTVLLLLSLREAVLGGWREAWTRFAWLWFGVVLVLFTVAATKLPHYVVYGYGGLFMVMARSSARLPNRWWVFLPQFLLLALLLALPFALPAVREQTHDAHVRAMLVGAENYFAPGYAGWLGLALVATVWLAWERRWPARWKLVASGLGLNILIATLVLPVVADIQQRPIKEAALLARDQAAPLVTWKLHNPSFSVYAGRIAEKRPPRPGDVVLTQTRHAPKLPAHEILYRKQGILLARLKAHP